MSYGVGCRRGSDPALLWLWCRLADTAPIQPLAWKLPYAMDMGLKGKKKKKSPFYFTLIFNFFGCPHSMQKFLGQESNPCNSSK